MNFSIFSMSVIEDLKNQRRNFLAARICLHCVAFACLWMSCLIWKSLLAVFHIWKLLSSYFQILKAASSNLYPRFNWNKRYSNLVSLSLCVCVRVCAFNPHAHAYLLFHHVWHDISLILLSWQQLPLYNWKFLLYILLILCGYLCSFPSFDF